MSRSHFHLVHKQKAIVTQLNELRTETERLEKIYQQKITAMDGLKKSLPHEAFTGKR